MNEQKFIAHLSKTKGENMKIAVSTTKGGLEDNVSQIFGRCPTFTLVEVNDKEIGKT